MLKLWKKFEGKLRRMQGQEKRPALCLGMWKRPTRDMNFQSKELDVVNFEMLNLKSVEQLEEGLTINRTDKIGGLARFLVVVGQLSLALGIGGWDFLVLPRMKVGTVMARKSNEDGCDGGSTGAAVQQQRTE
ncbi:hypothetical protein BY996DRAFT_6547709 [Phakopsora pachyrhizi]|nr:hypothetical protein BY996DRAFT_6547709 [Phakopsora pachyrhizi]